ncbi:sugar phosphate isomerase/epimerase family protein [Paenibacillus hexagrammi]|uniref:Sugar phosphate isomerase/epimerase n=1 Tax=Paenibacillus hexagrammi TaxID=2908839 RepID=A0ABY3SM76_9BACL|nr:sugar phosphate isomerase/epimerase [Paenibacillus sp. YPD9-1]UJF34062.1 sugar phosphate isomerase/epimerase [Paenibacillus sp. YPD9-1]
MSTIPLMSTKREPRLEVLMSWWGMNGLGAHNGAGAEWSMEEKVRRIAEAGYDGINGMLPEGEEAEEWLRLLETYHLSYSVNAYPKTAEELDAFLHKAKLFGKADFVNVQVMKPFLVGEEAVRLLAEMMELSRSAGIPAYIETHRGTITQDLLRTVEYVQVLPDLMLTIDFSHYVVAGEMRTVSEEADELLQKLLPRTKSMHARISNGEQVQVEVPVPSFTGGEAAAADIEFDYEAELPILKHFQHWWLGGMRSWRQSAQEGDVLPFVCELGPPPYAITTRSPDGVQREASDRWTQALLFARMARSLWERA